MSELLATIKSVLNRPVVRDLVKIRGEMDNISQQEDAKSAQPLSLRAPFYCSPFHCFVTLEL